MINFVEGLENIVNYNVLIHFMPLVSISLFVTFRGIERDRWHEMGLNTPEKVMQSERRRYHLKRPTLH